MGVHPLAQRRVERPKGSDRGAPGGRGRAESEEQERGDAALPGSVGAQTRCGATSKGSTKWVHKLMMEINDIPQYVSPTSSHTTQYQTNMSGER